MNQCSRCGRSHSGLCGIPAGVTLGFGASVSPSIGRIRTAKNQFSAHGRTREKRLSTTTLEAMLTGAKRQLTKVMEMLVHIPTELPEYTELLDREGKLNFLIKQLQEQIAVRRER